MATVWKSFWDVPDSVYDTIDHVLNRELLTEVAFQSYLKYRYSTLTREMHENKQLDEDEEYTIDMYRKHRKQQEAELVELMRKCNSLKQQRDPTRWIDTPT